MNKTGRFWGAAFLLGLSLFTYACVPDNSPPPASSSVQSESSYDAKEPLTVLTIGTADSGGTMYPVGSAIAQAISDSDSNIKVNTSASSGSITNVENLQNGQIDLGLISGDVAFCAYNGTKEYVGKPAKNLRAIAAVYTSLSSWMVPDSLGITYVHQLSGKRLSVGPKDSTTELSARTALTVIGINESNATFQNSGLGSSNTEVARGSLDAVHGFAGIPVAGLTQLASAIPSRLLQYTDEELSTILKQNLYYYKTSIPAGTYPGQTKEIKTFGVKCLIGVSSDMDDEMVYRLTKILDESRSRLIESHDAMQPMEQDDFLCQDLPIPLHPGAKAYYQDAGYISR